MILRYPELDDFEYEVGYDEVGEALESILNEMSKEELIQLLITDLDIQDDLKEYFEEDITEYFADEARESLQDEIEYRKDPLGYVGMSLKDFL